MSFWSRAGPAARGCGFDGLIGSASVKNVGSNVANSEGGRVAGCVGWNVVAKEAGWGVGSRVRREGRRVGCGVVGSGVDIGGSVGRDVRREVGSGVDIGGRVGRVGRGVGREVGSGVGGIVGSGVGRIVGTGVGRAVGAGVGRAVGAGVGERVGTGVGRAVGWGVGSGVVTGRRKGGGLDGGAFG